MLIGVTGKSGAGKSTFAKNYVISHPNFKIINVDEISHKVLHYPHIVKMIEDTFGVNVDETPRSILGDIIFNDRHEMKKLSDIIWAEMKCEIDKEIISNNDIIIEWILLPHTHYFKLCDYKILVKAKLEDRIKRVIERDNISIDYFNKRESNSIEYNEDDFDEIILN